jgi:hypothetical protein
MRSKIYFFLNLVICSIAKVSNHQEPNKHKSSIFKFDKDMPWSIASKNIHQQSNSSQNPAGENANISNLNIKISMKYTQIQIFENTVCDFLPF